MDTHSEHEIPRDLSMLKYNILGGRVDFGVRQKKHLISAHLGKNIVHLGLFYSSISGATITYFTWL